VGQSKHTIQWRPRIAYASAALGLVIAQGMASAWAQDGDLGEGEKLYTSQCKICHGNVAAPRQGERRDSEPVRLAMQQSAGRTMTDAVPSMAAGFNDATRPVAQPTGATRLPDPVAFAPPFGPNLRGVYGRSAGTVKGYDYSSTFLKTLKGMVWNDAALDVWITNPQAWVPGVYMYYKQPDPEIRRKIILYLKANP
jgi:cytochrome c2